MLGRIAIRLFCLNAALTACCHPCVTTRRSHTPCAARAMQLRLLRSCTPVVGCIVRRPPRGCAFGCNQPTVQQSDRYCGRRELVALVAPCLQQCTCASGVLPAARCAGIRPMGRPSWVDARQDPGKAEREGISGLVALNTRWFWEGGGGVCRRHVQHAWARRLRRGRLALFMYTWRVPASALVWSHVVLLVAFLTRI